MKAWIRAAFDKYERTGEPVFTVADVAEVAMKNRFHVDGPVTTIWVNHRGQEIPCLIDTADLATVRAIRGAWRARWVEHCQTFYVSTAIRGKSVFIHRMIMNLPSGVEVDHIHHNGLDNRRSELRPATRSENALNRRGAARNSKTGHRWIFKRGNSFRAHYRDKQNKRHEIGPFPTLELAISARDRAILREAR